MLENTKVLPVNQTYVSGREEAYIGQVLGSLNFSGPGQQGVICERLIKDRVGGLSVALVPSCSAALEMSALLIEISAGDEVIMPSFTFVSTANAVVLRGGVPVFIDIDPITLNLDPALIEAAITPKTKAIFVVHYAGVPADMKTILAIADRHNLFVIEDAAQAYGSTLNGRSAGSFGHLACFSFHGTKNISAGEAGALIVNDERFVQRAAIIREKGTDRSRFLAGVVDSYTWQDVGSSQIVNELTAAFLRAQLECASEINSARLKLWNSYHDGFATLNSSLVQTPNPPANVGHNGHIYFLMLPDQLRRISLSNHLARAEIRSATHYTPLHSSAAGRRFGRVSGSMRNTNAAAENLLRLPLYIGLEPNQNRVINAVLEWCHQQQADT